MSVPSIVDLSLRVGWFALLWWVLTAGAVDAWWIGVPVVAAAVYLSLRLRVPNASMRLLPLLRFVPYFAWESLRGGIDVARHALRPRLTLRPAFVGYPLRLPQGPAQVFFANAASLLPGTLCTSLAAHAVELHVLDDSLPIAQSLAELEQRIAEIFGIELVTRSSAIEESGHETVS